MFGKLLEAVGLAPSASGPRRALPVEFDALEKALGILGHLDPLWSTRAFEFVAFGEHTTILLDLANRSAEAGTLLGEPGRLTSGLWLRSHPQERDIKAALNQRFRFYRSAAVQPEQWLRLGKLLAAADQGKSLKQAMAGVPDWLQYLVNDAFGATLENNSSKQMPETDRPAFALPLLHALLVLDGKPGEAALLAAFECKDIYDYYRDRNAQLRDSARSVDYLRDHREAVRALPAKLSAEGRLLLLKTVGSKPALADVFGDVIVDLAVDSAKTVRSEAQRFLDDVPPARLKELLHARLSASDSGVRERAAGLIGQTLLADGVPLLEAALQTESSKAVAQAIRAAINGVTAGAAVAELPPPPAFTMPEDRPLGDEVLELLRRNQAELLAKLRAGAAQEIANNRENKRNWSWQQKQLASYEKLGDDDLRAAIAVLNGQSAKPSLSSDQEKTLQFSERLVARPEFSICHLVRWLAETNRRNARSFWHDPRLQSWLGRQDPATVDLRMFANLLKAAGQNEHAIALACLRPSWGASTPQEMLPADRVWPFLAEYPHLVDIGLGLKPQSADRQGQFELAETLTAIETFPVLQPAWVARLMTIALGESKTHRPAAQKVLGKLPDLGARVIEALGSSKQEVRIIASEWLAELDYRAAVPAVRAALDKESRETVRASLMTTLEALGEDIRPMLAPERLAAEAKKGLKAKAPAGLAWFPLDALPACRWAADGKPVDADILRWWVVLACKLKEPGGNALLARYLGLLEDAGREALGSFVLRQFIAQDTRSPDSEACADYAKSRAQGRLDMYQRWSKHSPEYATRTYDTCFEELRREKSREYLGSAIAEKGILALASGASGHELVSMVQAYMRDHYMRRSQIEAMLMSAAGSADPVVIQLLLSVSRRYRTQSIQELARSLVESIAERNHWTQDQLADRTIPTAGFDEQGVLTLDYGDRQLTVTLDAAMKPVLKNAEGKVLKALPEPRQSDDADRVKEIKATFSGCKKELKQAIDLQTGRLYEAMCAGRVWPVAEWVEYLQQHPIMGRLVQRLVWQTVAMDGAVDPAVPGASGFRPTEDGSLIDVHDDEVVLPTASLASSDAPAGTGTGVRLAHPATLGADGAKAWQRHLKDYKVDPLFAQMSRTMPDLSGLKAGAESIEDRQGWLSDAFTLRGAFGKLGYQRGQGEDGGFFYEYAKEFSSVGLRVVMTFTGNTLPEENVAAALKSLSFERPRARRHTDRIVKIDAVPPVLLAEAYGDYHAVAEACGGFDPQWEQKSPW